MEQHPNSIVIDYDFADEKHDEDHPLVEQTIAEEQARRVNKKVNSPEARHEFEEHLKMFELALPDVIEKAIIACEKRGFNWRKFLVGCAMFCYKESTGEYEIIFKGNYTPRNEKRVGEDKTCAERRTYNEVLEDGELIVVGMVIASQGAHTGEPDMKESEVLWPCVQCQNFFKEKPGMVRDETKVVSVRFKMLSNDEEKGFKYTILEKQELPMSKLGSTVKK